MTGLDLLIIDSCFHVSVHTILPCVVYVAFMYSHGHSWKLFPFDLDLDLDRTSSSYEHLITLAPTKYKAVHTRGSDTRPN